MDVGAISHTYTVIVERKSPSPTPAIQRPMRSIGIEEAAHSRTDPSAKIMPPRAKVRVRDILSDRGPATKEDRDAVIRMEDTIKPCNVGEIGSNLFSNSGMTVMGPIEPIK